MCKACNINGCDCSKKEQEDAFSIANAIITPILDIPQKPEIFQKFINAKSTEIITEFIEEHSAQKS